MKFTIKLLALSLLLCASCNEDEEEYTDCSIASPVDLIVHSPYAPSIEFSSVDTLVTEPVGFCLIPEPATGSDSFLLDINLDGINDFSISMRTGYDFVSASNPCVNYTTFMSISGLLPDNELAIADNSGRLATFDQGEVIDSSLDWRNLGQILVSVPQTTFGIPSNVEKHIGLRILYDNSRYYGWMRLSRDDYYITIYAFALNFGYCRPIVAGQIE